MRAKKLILVSAGTFGSPGILERSGIGAKDVLERVGVKQQIDLPGVGENYQGLPIQFPSDHLGCLISDALESMCRPRSFNISIFCCG